MFHYQVYFADRIITGFVGVAKDSTRIIDISFDILSLEALFLLPRVCSLLSLIPFFGTLVGDCAQPVVFTG